MSDIDPDLFTVVIRFEVPRENQARFVDELTESVGATTATLPGFRSARFMASSDGTSVINLAQWDDAEIYERSINSATARRAGVGEILERHGARPVHTDSYRFARTFER